MSYGILVQVFKMPSWLTNTKRFFGGNEANVETLQKLSPCISVSYKFLFKSVNSLNRIFLATEYWFNTLKCQIWLTNTKPFFWKSKPNIKTLQKLSP